ncbi:MAG: DUF4292 domain-containing protein, partial [Bacteroidales bacterium]|nr:DUF4292 domain-containing protein [Bacteroidales bacterium]
MLKIKYLAIIVLIFVINSCKIKNIDNNETLEMSKLYEKLQKSNLKYNTLSIKFNTRFDNSEKSLGLKGTVKIKKDSVIIVSLIAVLGIEAAKLKFTKDSLFIIDRLNSEVKSGNYEYLKKTFKVDLTYNDLQSILTNYFFVYPHSEQDKNEFINNFKFRKDSIFHSVYRKMPNSIENLINIENENYKILDYFIFDIAQSRSLKIQYEGNFSKEIQNLPKKISINSDNSNKLTSVELIYTKVSVDKELNFSFNIPEN